MFFKFFMQVFILCKYVFFCIVGFTKDLQMVKFWICIFRCQDDLDINQKCLVKERNEKKFIE